MARSEIKIGGLLSYVSIFLGTFISIIYTPIMLRLLGQSEYGLMSLANSVVGYLNLLNLGIGSAMVRYISKYKAENDKNMENAISTFFLYIFTFLALLALIIGIILTYNADILFQQSLSDLEFRKLKILMLIIVVNLSISMISSVFNAIMMAHEKFVFLKVIGVLTSVVSPLVMLPLLYLGYKSIGMVVASTLLNLITIIIIVSYVLKKIHFRLRFQKFTVKFMKELVGFSFFVLLGMIVDKVYWSTDQFILGAISGTISVAVYSIGSNFTLYFMSFSSAISGLFLPRLTQMDVNKVNEIEFSLLFVKVGRIQFLILGFVLGGFILLGREFITLWAGPDYESSYFIALVILIPFTIPLIQNLGLQLMYARNLHKFRSLTLLGIAIINVLLSIPLARYYGGLGCAAVTGLSLILGQGFVLNWFYSKKMHLDIKLFWKNIIRICLVLIIILTISYFILRNLNCFTWGMLLVGACIYTLIYFICMWFVAMNGYERNLVVSFIPFRKK